MVECRQTFSILFRPLQYGEFHVVLYVLPSYDVAAFMKKANNGGAHSLHVIVASYLDSVQLYWSETHGRLHRTNFASENIRKVSSDLSTCYQNFTVSARKMVVKPHNDTHLKLVRYLTSTFHFSNVNLFKIQYCSSLSELPERRQFDENHYNRPHDGQTFWYTNWLSVVKNLGLA